MVEEKTHYKMYKAKKRWMVAGITMFGAVLGMGTIPLVNADNVQNIKTNNVSSSVLKENTNNPVQNNSTSFSSHSSVSQKDNSATNNSNELKNNLNSQQNDSVYNNHVENNYEKIQKNVNKNTIVSNPRDNTSISIAEQNNPTYDKQVQTRNAELKQMPEKVATPAFPQMQKSQQPQAQNKQVLDVKSQTRDAQQQITFGSCNDLNQVVVDLKNSISGDLNNQVQFSNGGGVKSVSENGNQLTITTNNDIDFQKAMTVTVDGQQYTIDPTNGTAMPVVRSQAFDNKYTYNGHDLGANYTPTATTFKIWAPTASQVSLNLYDNDTDPKAKLKSWQHMQYDENTGVWSITVNGDLKDTAYDYLVQFANGKSNETYDPYATACVQGGFRSVVLSPEEMGNDVTAGKVVDKDDPTNEVIGEIDVRDFTNDPSSGVAANVRGTYVGAAQSTNTTDGNGNPTGINYLTHQGINTVQIQPMYQYDDDSDNTNSSYEYDWGYDPENYNVPEGWYSTNRDDPATRIKECKEMIQAFHDAGIRVNMDVVYNHVANVKTNALALTVPGYYFRYGNNGQLTNASACGDDVASERNMVRNYIVQSCEYWHKVYGLDGFRFDLMGNLDVKTMNAIRAALPDVVMYGEGWNMGASIPDSDKADQANEKQMPTIGTFNGWGRTVIRGDDNGNPHGYITGQTGQQQMSSLANFIWGCQNLPNTPSNAVDGGVNYANPSQIINYTECHDNKTLYDTIRAAYPSENPDVSMRRAELGNAITILNEGVPFVQVGQGFGRSKNGDGNSYRSGDKVNNIHWDTQDGRTWATAYEKALIQLRNSDPAFRMTSYSDMNNNMKWIEINNDNGVIGYELTSPETGKKYIIAYSNNASSQQLTGLANGQYKVLIKNCNGYLNDPQTIDVTNGTTDIPSLSCLVLEQDPVNNTKPSQNNGNSTSSSSSTPVKPATGSQSGTSTTTTKPSASTPVKPAGNSNNNSPSANKPANNGQSSSNTNSNVSKYTYTITYYDGNTGAQVGTATFDTTSKLSDSQLANKVQSGTKDKVSSYNVDQDNVNGNEETITVVATVNKAQSNPKVYNYTISYFNSQTGASEGTYSFTSSTPLSGNDLLNKIQAGTKDKIDSYETDESHESADGNTDNITIVAMVGSSKANGSTTKPGSSSNPGSSTSTPAVKPSGSSSSSSTTSSGSSASKPDSSSSSSSNKPANTKPSGSTSSKPDANKPSDSTSSSSTTSSGSSASKPDSSTSSSSNKPVDTKPSDSQSKPTDSTSSSSSNKPVDNPSAGNTDEDKPVQRPDGSKANNPADVKPNSTHPGQPATNADHDGGKNDGNASQTENDNQNSGTDHETDETGNGPESPVNGSSSATSSKAETSTTDVKPTDAVKGESKKHQNGSQTAIVDNGKSHDELTNNGNSQNKVQENRQATVKAEKAETVKTIEQTNSGSGNNETDNNSTSTSADNASVSGNSSSESTTSTKAKSNNQGLPQTGEEENHDAAEIGLAMLGVVGTVSIGFRRKRYGI